MEELTGENDFWNAVPAKDPGFLLPEPSQVAPGVDYDAVNAPTKLGVDYDASTASRRPFEEERVEGDTVEGFDGFDEDFLFFSPPPLGHHSHHFDDCDMDAGAEEVREVAEEECEYEYEFVDPRRVRMRSFSPRVEARRRRNRKRARLVREATCAITDEVAASSSSSGAGPEKKSKERKRKNREAARLHRQRKQEEMLLLQHRADVQAAEAAALRERVRNLERKNEELLAINEQLVMENKKYHSIIYGGDCFDEEECRYVHDGVGSSPLTSAEESPESVGEQTPSSGTVSPVHLGGAFFSVMLIFGLVFSVGCLSIGPIAPRFGSEYSYGSYDLPPHMSNGESLGQRGLASIEPTPFFDQASSKQESLWSSSVALFNALNKERNSLNEGVMSGKGEQTMGFVMVPVHVSEISEQNQLCNDMECKTSKIEISFGDFSQADSSREDAMEERRKRGVGDRAVHHILSGTMESEPPDTPDSDDTEDNFSFHSVTFNELDQLSLPGGWKLVVIGGINVPSIGGPAHEKGWVLIPQRNEHHQHRMHVR